MPGVNRWIPVVVAVAVRAAAAVGETVVLDGHAAFVNDRSILISDVLRYVLQADRQAARHLSGVELEKALDRNYREGLKALIERELILAEAERRKLDLPDQALDAQINQIVRERFAGDRTAFLAALAADGLLYAEYRDQIRGDLRVMLLRRQEVTDRVSVSPAEVRAAYEARLESYRQPEQVRARLIAIRRGKSDAEAAARRKLAETARERVLRGESFEAVAREVSEGPAAVEGGDLGWRRPSELRPELAAMVAQMTPGQISLVVEVGEEFHILALEGRREAHVLSFERVAGELEKELLRDATQRRLEAWLSDLRLRHYVRVVQESRP